MSPSLEMLLSRSSRALQMWIELFLSQDRLFPLQYAFCLSIVLLSIALHYSMNKAPAKSIGHSFRTLQSFVIPTGSLWPPYYTKVLTRHASSNISLSLDTLITDVCEGRMELRNSEHILDCLVKHHRFTTAQGVHLDLIVENQLIAELLAWRLLGDLTSKKVYQIIYACSFDIISHTSRFKSAYMTSASTNGRKHPHTAQPL